MARTRVEHYGKFLFDWGTEVDRAEVDGLVRHNFCITFNRHTLSMKLHHKPPRRGVSGLSGFVEVFFANANTTEDLQQCQSRERTDIQHDQKSRRELIADGATGPTGKPVSPASVRRGCSSWQLVVLVARHWNTIPKGDA
mmetsp:Transcript_87378/g.150740  ORF Transcript_87378/g.150740 Transcript_87378/m.150740 type:complete len:140 (+) Transcript_87378:446-865(+)